jgi:hypothetical protein
MLNRFSSRLQQETQPAPRLQTLCSVRSGSLSERFSLQAL